MAGGRQGLGVQEGDEGLKGVQEEVEEWACDRLGLQGLFFLGLACDRRTKM